ncbi:MAG: hypothetical protein EPN25_08415 [Nitrospirae bacterium]|nr:MAG: hypothetical protein EPN25_08415 [Nitrospirota bacterium]
MTILLISSVILQFVAAIMAIRMIWITGGRTGWALVAAAVLGMALRRSIAFSWIFSGGTPHPLDPLFETVGLITSLLMVIGLYLIRPVLASIRESREAMRELNERLSLETEKQRLLIENIRTLKGLLPICAWCKSIRDDQGYWKKVEEYIRDNSEAEFTHGICPDCAEKVRASLDDIKRT